jgi:ribosome-associated toxin RatA of RatAB toxin-antitoxin module
MPPLEFSDSVVVAATPNELYAMVSDVTRTGEWSPICRACWWDEGDGPRVGAHFTGRNDDSTRTWDTRSEVVVADVDREFAWEVNGGWVRWGFTMEPVDDPRGGTRLTESWSFLPKGIAGFGERFGAAADAEIAKRSTAALDGIPTTLAAIKNIAEA